MVRNNGTTGRVIHMYGRHATAVVAYTFNAEILCPDCTLRAVKATYPLDFPLASTILPGDTAEDILRTVAKSLNLNGAGIDPGDESTFDSDEFPEVVFSSDLEDSERCMACGEEL